MHKDLRAEGLPERPVLAFPRVDAVSQGDVDAAGGDEQQDPQHAQQGQPQMPQHEPGIFPIGCCHACTGRVRISHQFLSQERRPWQEDAIFRRELSEGGRNLLRNGLRQR